MPPTPGLSGTAELVVAEDDTALAMLTGDVPVLATPRVVRLAEQASVQAIEGTLAEGTTSVGYRVQLDHLAPTAVGGKVRAEATSEMIEGRRLTFRVSVSDGHGLVAAGRITRVIGRTGALPGESRRSLIIRRSLLGGIPASRPLAPGEQLGSLRSPRCRMFVEF